MGTQAISMPDEQIVGLLKYVAEDPRLDLTLRIFDGDRHAPVGLTTKQLEKILFVAGTAEILYCYWEYLLGNKEGQLYPEDAVRGLAGFATFGPALSPQNFDELSKFYAEQFGITQRTERIGGFWSIGSSDTLRIQLVALYKENPTSAKISAFGKAGAMITLALCFGAAEIQHSSNEGDCLVRQERSLQQAETLIMQQSRLQGHMTPQLESAWGEAHATFRAGIAACGCHLDPKEIEISRNGKIDISFGHPEGDKKGEVP